MDKIWEEDGKPLKWMKNFGEKDVNPADGAVLMKPASALTFMSRALIFTRAT